jgi:hypothetical protein
MTVNFNWECPYCGRPQVVTSDNFHSDSFIVIVGKNDLGDVATYTEATACLNEKCRKLSLMVQLRNRSYIGGNWILNKQILHEWRLLPESNAKPQPDYIPAPITTDYYEACRIRDLSPKASATLARRCLQGMIRDFCKISKNRLVDEIEALRQLVDQDKAPKGVTHDSVDAIDHVRKIGNIGAHMEKDIDLIVDIDPGEAQMLLDLVETLFEEWYVARNDRQERFSKLGSLSLAKEEAKKK